MKKYLVLTRPQEKQYILLDEVQFFKNWQIFIKSKYESNKNIKFIITGSNSWMLSSEFSTLLSGRNIKFQIFPFSFKEICNSKKISTNSAISLLKNEIELRSLFEEYLQFGGFPEIFLLENKENFKLILQSYSKNILYQDIIPRFEVKKINEMEKLYTYLLSNYSNPYSYNRLSKIFTINDKTIKEYLKYFQEAFLFYEIEKFDFSLKKQQLNEKKSYISDLGFINAISFKFGEDKGKILENLVFIELKRRGKEIYYHKQKKECDFVVKEELSIVQAIQVTQSLENISTKKREVEGLLDACKEYELSDGLILTQNEEDLLVQDDINIEVKPIWKWLLENHTKG